MIRETIRQVFEEFLAGVPALSRQVIEPRITELADQIASKLSNGPDLISRDEMERSLQATFWWYQPDDEDPRPLKDMLRELDAGAAEDRKRSLKLATLQAASGNALKACDTEELLTELRSRFKDLVAVMKSEDQKLPTLCISDSDMVVLAGMLALGSNHVAFLAAKDR